jgi:hypothetical protein
MRPCVLSGIRPRFQGLSQSAGQIAHVLLTRSPLIHPPKEASPFDLHVLSTPPAFVLSQDQTLRECFTASRERNRMGGITPPVHSVLADNAHQPQRTSRTFKGTLPQPKQTGNGVSTYLALTFGTLLSSQETDDPFAAPPEAPPDVPFRFHRL